MAEQIYFATINAISRAVEKNRDEYEDIIMDLDAALVDRYFCNFSVFQSLPDSWAIDQLFPIMPIHRLIEEPTRRGTLQDVTCDSDGKIDRFVGDKNGRPSLELHGFTDGEPYILGVFLTGSDTSSNTLFGPLQAQTAQQLGNVSPILTAGTNSSGGVMGKMISPQNLSVGAAGVNKVGAEGAIFARVIKYSLILTTLVGIVAMIEAYVLPGIIPSP